MNVKSDVIEPMAIDLQTIPKKFWKLTMNWVETYCPDEYIDDLKLQPSNS